MPAPPRPPRIEILVFDGCPNAQPARELVERVAGELDITPAVETVVVREADTAARARFLGSPTIRVNGRDVEPGAEERRDYVVSCRVYRTRDGLSGQPDESWLRAALAA